MQEDGLVAPSQSHRMVIDNCDAEDKSRAAFSACWNRARPKWGGPRIPYPISPRPLT